MKSVVSHAGETTTADPKAASTVWYDGACPICSREIAWYGRMSGASEVRWIDVSDADAPLPEGKSRAELLGRFTVARRGGALATGAEGFSALWRALGPTRLLGRLTDRQPFRAVGEALYRLFLRLRMLWRR